MRIGGHRPPSAPTRPSSPSPAKSAKTRGDTFERVRPTPFVRRSSPAPSAGGTTSTSPATFGRSTPDVPTGTRPDLGAKATPQETVAYLLRYEQMDHSEGNHANLFVQGLEPHLDDPAWLQGFYEALGTEQAARLANAALHPSSYQDWPPETAQEHARIAMTSLSALHASGQLNAADMDALVGQWAEVGPGDTFNPGLALAAGELGPEHEAFQTRWRMQRKG